MPTNRHTQKAAVDVYAQTLVDALAADGGIEAIMEARSQIDEIIRYNRSHIELGAALADPQRTPEQKGELVRSVFADCQPALQSVLGVMAERGDMDKLPRIWDGFNSQIGEKMNVAVVDVITRIPLDDHLRDVIKQKAHADLGVDIVLDESIDPDMIGGIIMSANGKRIDASVNTLLEGARQVLKKNTDGGES